MASLIHLYIFNDEEEWMPITRDEANGILGLVPKELINVEDYDIYYESNDKDLEQPLKTKPVTYIELIKKGKREGGEFKKIVLTVKKID